MKHCRLFAISSLFLAATVSAGVARRAAADTEVDAGKAFSRLKALVGDWDVESSNSKAHSRFELIAGGSALLEHFAERDGQEMLTAYHLDGSRLVLAHYCIAGNQPQIWRRSLMSRRANWISRSRVARISPPAQDTCTTRCSI
jgi:hypothetical protein